MRDAVDEPTRSQTTVMPDDPYDFSQLPSQAKPQLKLPQEGKYRPNAGQRYGAPRPYGPHTGEDFGWPKGTVVGTPVAGRVRFAGKKGGYGNRVEIEHDDGTTTTYSHLDSIGVREGDDLDSGSLVGNVGATGTATGPNVHFEVIRGGRKLNPEKDEYQPVRDAKEVRYRNGYDFSKLPSQQGEQFDFSQLPSQSQVPPAATPAASPAQPSTSSPTPQPSGVNVSVKQAGANPKAPATNTSPWTTAGAEPDPLDEALRTVTPHHSAQSDAIERGSLPIDTPDRIPGIDPYHDRVEPTDKPGSVRVINEEREAKIAAQRKRVERARREAGRARRQLRVAQASSQNIDVTPERLAEDAAQGEALSSIVSPDLFEKPSGVFFVGGNDGGYHGQSAAVNMAASALAEASARHRREQAELNRLTKEGATERTAELPHTDIVERTAWQRVLDAHGGEDSINRSKADWQTLGRDPAEIDRTLQSEFEREKLEVAREIRESTPTPEDAADLLARQQSYGRSSPGYKMFVQPFESFAGDVGQLAGNVVWATGKYIGWDGARDMGAYLKRRAALTQESAETGSKDLPTGYKIGRTLLSGGLDVAKLVILSEATGFKLATVMAGESVVRNLDKDAGEQVSEATKAYLLGRALELAPGALREGAERLPGVAGKLARNYPAATDRTVGATVFGGLGAGQAALNPNADKSDVIAEAAGGTLLGALLAGGSPHEREAAGRKYEKPFVLTDETGRSIFVEPRKDSPEGYTVTPVDAERASELGRKYRAQTVPVEDYDAAVELYGEFAPTERQIAQTTVKESPAEGRDESSNVQTQTSAASPSGQGRVDTGDSAVTPQASGSVAVRGGGDVRAEVAKEAESVTPDSRAVPQGQVRGRDEAAGAKDVQGTGIVPNLSAVTTGREADAVPHESSGMEAGRELSAPAVSQPSSATDSVQRRDSSEGRSTSALPANISEGQTPQTSQGSENVETGAPREFHHADFGNVVEAENQKGVSKGSVRVTDEQGSEHIIQEPNGRGEGNQKAVRVRHRGIYIEPRVEADARAVKETQSAEAAETEVNVSAGPRLDEERYRSKVAENPSVVGLDDEEIPPAREAFSTLEGEARALAKEQAALTSRLADSKLRGRQRERAERDRTHNEIRLTELVDFAEDYFGDEARRHIKAISDGAIQNAHEVTTPIVEYKKIAPVSAEVSKEPFEWKTSDGQTMKAEAGDWKVTQPDGSISSVKPSVFEKTYEASRRRGYYRKSGTTKAQQLDKAIDIQTLEGKGHGEAGDYLVTGPEGEQYVVPRKKFEELYRPSGASKAARPKAEEPHAPLRAYAEGIVKAGGARSVMLIGSTAEKGRGNDVDLLYGMGRLGLPADETDAAERLAEIIEGSDAPFDLDSYDTFIKADGRYFHLSGGAGREFVENTEYAEKQKGRRRVLLAGAEDFEDSKTRASDADTTEDLRITEAAPQTEQKPETPSPSSPARQGSDGLTANQAQAQRFSPDIEKVKSRIGDFLHDAAQVAAASRDKSGFRGLEKLGAKYGIGTELGAGTGGDFVVNLLSRSMRSGARTPHQFVNALRNVYRDILDEVEKNLPKTTETPDEEMTGPYEAQSYRSDDGIAYRVMKRTDGVLVTEVNGLTKEEATAKAADLNRPPAQSLPAEPSISQIFDEEFDQMFGEEMKAKSLKEVATGLNDLFGGSPLKSARAEEIDEEKYLQAKTLFEAGIEHSGGDLSDVRAAVKGLLSSLRSQFDMQPEVIQRMKPYIVRFIEESETAKEATGLQAGTRNLIDAIKERLRGEGIKDNPQLTRMADEAFGGTRAQGVYGPKDAYDALETAVNELLSEDAKRLMAGDPKEALRELRALLRKLPTQTDRTTEQQELQQFSTPPTEAFVAAKALSPTPDDVVLEPSAGTGSLALWPKAAGAKVYANEIAPRRRALLEAQGYETTSVDAQFLDDLLPEDIQPTAVLMNPPFSSTGGRVAKNKTIYGAEHVTDALKRLSDGGRLVAIVGEGMGLDRPAFREWWSRVFKEYNVRANISVPGEEYGKYGTTFGNQLVIIDKTGPTPGETLAEQTANVITASPRDLEGVLDAIEPIIADRPLAQARRDIRRGGGRPAVETETHRSPEPVGAREKSGRAADEDTRRQAGQSRTRLPQTESADEPRPPGADTASESGGGDDLGLRQQLKFERNTEEREDDSANFVTYRPAKLKGGVKHPGLIVESASMAAVDPPDITYAPKLDPKIVSEGKLSDLQYEAVSYSGQRHEQRLPDGRRAAMFIGDGTGVGKGRILAGITLDNWNRGRRRIVWMSVNTDLVPSTERDLRDLGAVKIPLAVINDFSAQSSQLDFADGVLFVAYPTLVKTAQNGQTRFDQIREWLGDDGLILLDEAHLAKNAVTEGMKESSQRGEKIVALQEGEQTNPNWRFVYASATGATEVANMGYMARLGLWGDGTSFPGGFAEFKSAIDGGGVGAMEMVSRDMKAMGMYTARTLSFKGVAYREAVHSLTPTQRELYDTAAKAWQVVLQNVNRALDITNADSRAKMHARRRFWNDQQRFFRQFITALKVPTAIREIDKALGEGNSVVLGLYGTGEARTKEQVKKALAVGSDLEDLDFSPKEILRNLVAKAFPTQRYTEQSDPSNPKKIIKVPVVDSDGRPVESAQAKAMRDGLLEELDRLALPENPLDQIVNHFGPDRVAEITGRSKRLVRNPETGKNEYVKRVSGVSMEKASQHEMDAFQEGRKRIAIISAAASTGISLHADNTRANKERRAHITLETGWSADIQMQTFGRTHRSNEASQPEYVLLATDVGGEKRFLSTIAKRLASLGALTKGERKATGMGSGEEGLEKYDFVNDYGRAAIHNITDQVRMNRGPQGLNSADTWERMGLVKKTDRGTEFEEPDVERFLNRILALGLNEQNRMFDWFTETFDRVVVQAKESGTFDEGVTDIKGDAVRMTGEPQVVATDKTTGAETVHYQMEVDERTKPVEFESLTGKKGDFYKQNRSGNVIFAEESGSRTDAAGRVYRRYYVTLPRASRDHLVEEQDLAGKYTQIKSEEAKSLWDVEYAEVPKVRTKEVHLIGGAIIPVWQRLQQRDSQGNAVQLKVVRMVTDGGRRVVGVRIPTKSVGTILKAIGVQRSFKEPSAIFNSVYEQGETVKLVSGLSLERVRFKGDDAVELKGADRYKINELKGMGLRHEIVNYDDRLFVPTNEKTGVEVLTKLLERYPAMSEDAPLKMARANEKSLEDLRDADFHNLVPNATVKRDGHLLEVNAEGHEILRRAFEQRSIDAGTLEPTGDPVEARFDGVFLKPQQIKETAAALRRGAKELLMQGHPQESAEKLNSLAAKLTRAGLVGGKQSGKNTAIVYVYDEAIPHEEWHRAGFIGAVSEGLASRHANFTELASHPVIQKAWDNYFSRVNGYSRLDEAVLVEETGTWIAGGKALKLGLTEEESADYLDRWLASYADKNGEDKLDNFAEVALPHARQIISQLRRRRADGRRGEGRDEGRNQGVQREQAETRASQGSDKASPQESPQEEVKKRRLPSTLREMGLRAADELYEVYPNKAANRDAKALFEKLGFEGSENLLQTTGQMGAEHVQLSKILQRALLSEASKVSESDVEQASQLRQRAQDLASDLAARMTKGGQFIQAADSVESSVEDVMATAVKVAKERGRELTPKEASEIHRAGEQLEASTATLEIAAVQANEARSAVESDKEEIARAEAGELSPDEVKGIKDRLKRLREREQELSERERKRTAEGAKLSEQLAKQRETLASLREKERRRERNIAEMEGRLPERKRAERAKSPSARQRAAQSLSMDESDLVAEVMAALGQRPLMMARADETAAPTTPNRPKPIGDETVNKLARLGAIRLLRAERGKYTVSDFRRDMLNDFGPQVEPHLDAIHAEAVQVMRTELRRANLERRLEAIKAREGNEDLSRGELTEIAEREKEEKRRASLVQAEHEKVAKAFESKDEREAKSAKRESKDEFQKSQSFVRDMARKASRVFQRTAGGRDVGSKALAQAIARHATNDVEAIAAAKLASGISPSEFASQMKAEHGLDKKGLHAAFKGGAEVLEKARTDINTSRQMAAALKKASKATTQAERDRALAELRQARADRASAQRQVANQLQRMKTPTGGVGAVVKTGRVLAKGYRLTKGALIGLMAGGDASNLARQGGMGVLMHPSMAKDFAVATFEGLSDARYARNVDNLEHAEDFTLAQRAGVNFTVAGQHGSGTGEEYFADAELLKHVPLVSTYEKKSEQVFSGGMDWQRYTLSHLWFDALRSAKANYSEHPEAYVAVGKLVNIITGRGDINQKNRAAVRLLYGIGQWIGFSPRFRVSRLQFLTLPLDPTGIFWQSPPAARRIIWKAVARYYAAIGATLGLLFLTGLLTKRKLVEMADPDSPDFLKLRLGKMTIDITQGNQTEARLLLRMLAEGYRGLTGQVTGGMAAEQETRMLLRWLRSGQDPLTSLGTDKVLGEDFNGNPFHWDGMDGAIATRLMPMIAAQSIQAGREHGWQYGVGTGVGEFIGTGTSTYDERERAQSTAEKLATRFSARDYGNTKPLDEQTKKKLDELKTRARKGEDVADELDPLVSDGVITSERADAIANAKNQTYLEEKFRQLSLDDKHHVIKYADDEERKKLEPILKRAEADKGAALSDEAKKAYTSAGKEFYHAPSTLKLAGRDRKLSDDERTRLDTAVSENFERVYKEFLNPQDGEARKDLEEYRSADREGRRKVLDRLQRRALNSAHGEFRSEWVDSHSDELDAEEGYKFTDEEKSEMQRQSGAAAEKSVNDFLNPRTASERRRFDEYEKASPDIQRKMLDGVRREAIEGARGKFKQSHKDRLKVSAYPMFRPQAAA